MVSAGDSHPTRDVLALSSAFAPLSYTNVSANTFV